MVTQQVVAPPARAAIFLVLTANEGSEQPIREFLADLSGLTRSVSFRTPDDDLNCILGIGDAMWDRLFVGAKPKHLHPFKELRGARHFAPSTPGDLLIHLRARHLDSCFELARIIMNRLREYVEVADETHGFKYYDERDLLGFVDGTENPEGAAAPAAVLVGDDDPTFADSSYVIVQKYTHDLKAWHDQSVEEQERVIGRSKLDDVEMPDDIKPKNSHVHLNTVTDENGVQQQIIRDNMPFGQFGTDEFGTYFIGYAKDPAVTEEMLRNMFIGSPPGNTDRILDFSTAQTGGLFFVPTVDFLDSVTPESPASVMHGESDNEPSDGSEDDTTDQPATSLSVGSLRDLPND